LVFAEFLPKVLFRINPNRLLTVFAFPVYLLYALMYPLVVITMIFSRFFLRVFFKMDIDDQKRGFGFVDIDNFLKEYSAETKSNTEEGRDLQLFKNAIEFPDIKVRECMTPRTEIVAVAHNEKPDKIRQVFSKTGFSKVPVYRDSIDNIIGYLHVYDFFKKPKEISEIIKPLVLVPETMLIKNLFDRLIKQKKSIAVVVDEFGGTSGIITIEDIMEEIFGEIDDEHDFESLLEKKIGEGEYILSARLEIDYLNESYGFNIPESEEYNTLGGFILNHMETIPVKGQELLFEGKRFKISQVSKKLIEKVLVKVD
jgi:CBS domain containing-hemolysin-like protein